jgi:hypothetical protein
MKTTSSDRRKMARLASPWNWRRHLGGSRREPARRDRGLRPLLEEVEGRLLLSSISLNKGVLTATGTAATNTVALGLTNTHGVQVTLDGFTASFTPGTVTSVDIMTSGSNNTVNIEATAHNVPVNIDLESGTGTVNISPTAKNLGNIQGIVTVTGGNSADVLNINDQNNSAASTYSLTSSSVTRSGSAAITYQSMDKVNLYGGSANDTYNIQSTASGVTTFVEGGAGNDTFNVSPTAENLANIQGPLTLWGLGGSNALNIYDVNNSAASTYSLTSSSVTRSGSAAISYASVDAVTLDGGSNNDTYNIDSTASGTPVSITGGGGNNLYQISPVAKDLDTIQGSVSIEGGTGTNTLIVYDQNYTGPFNYSVTSSSVSRSGAAPITFSSIHSLQVDYGT